MLLHNAWSTESLSPADFFPTLQAHVDPAQKAEELRLKLVRFHAHYGGNLDDIADPER
jgi:hypothetical protein